MTRQRRLNPFLLLVCLLPMSLLALYVQNCLPITNPDVYYSLLPEQESVTWSLVPSHFAMAPNSAGVPRSVLLDLTTGKQSTLPFAFYQVLDRSPNGTVTIQQFKQPGPGIEIAQWPSNAKSSRVLWQVDRILPVLNHRYLLSSQANRIVAYDLNHSRSQRPDAIDICVDPQRVSPDDLQCIQGKNSLLVSRTLGSNSVAVYSVNDGQVTENTSWRTGGLAARAVIRQGQVYSLSQDGLSLEVRDSQQFHVIDRRPLPPNMIGQWSTAKCGQFLVTIEHPKTAAYETYLLQDMSPIPELNGWAPYKLRYGEIGHHRYHLFSPPDRSQRKLLVYDGLSRKIALEHDTGYDYVEACVIGDDRLAIIDYRCGLTCKVIDLTTGNVVATHRPLFWPLLSTIILNVALILWVISWLRFSAQAGIPIVVDWCILGAVILAPMLYRAWTLTWMTTQPSMNLVHACWLASIYAAGYSIWFGGIRIAYHICACVMFLAASAGLLQFREWVHWTSSPTAIAIVWLHFMNFTMLSIVAARVVTLPRLGAIDLGKTGASARTKVWNIQLSDLFMLTAVSALLIGSILPMKSHLKSPFILVSYNWALSGITIVAFASATGLFFSRWKTAERLRTLLVGVACLFVIGQWIIKLIDFKLAATLTTFVYSSELVGLACVCFLVASAWAWRLRTTVSTCSESAKHP